MRPAPIESWVNNLLVIGISAGLSIASAVFMVSREYAQIQDQIKFNTDRLNKMDKLDLTAKIAGFSASDADIKGELERRLSAMDQQQRDLQARIDRITEREIANGRVR